MPPYRDLDTGALIGTVLGSYKEVQRRYGDALLEEHVSKNAKVAALGHEAREVVASAALEAARLRAEAEFRVEEIRLEAEAAVRELEARRLEVMAAHHRALREIEERTEAERAATDQRILDTEAEVEALFLEGEDRIREIQAEREAAVRDARRRVAAADDRGEERSKRAERTAKDIEAEAHESVRKIEKECAWQVREMDTRCQAWLQHSEEAIRDVQREVALSIEAFLAEARGSRRNLAESRSRADQHLQLELAGKRQETAQMVLESERALQDARLQLREANASADEAFESLAKDCAAQRRDQAVEVTMLVEGVHGAINSMGWLERVNDKQRIEVLEELAKRLRRGEFMQPPPKIPRDAVHNVVPAALLAPASPGASPRSALGR